MNSNPESKGTEVEINNEDKSELKTHEIGYAEATDLPIDKGSQKCSAFEVTESIANISEEGDPLISNEADCDVDDEGQNNGPMEGFEIALEEVKVAIRNDVEKNEPKEDLLETSVIQKYRTACENYAVFPLEECIETLDKDIIDFSDFNLGPLSFKPIVESLFISTNLTQLILPNNKLGIDGLKWISHLFTIKDRITYLDLENNLIGPRGNEYIENILNNGFYLEFLDLSGNGLSDAQLIGISRVLNNNCFKLKELNLRDNNFRSESGQSLGQCLASNVGLQKLDLSFNKFKEGAAYIFAGLRSNSYLKTLDLSSNEINEKCAVELAKFLATNKCLEELNLKHNYFTRDGMIVIRKYLKSNRTLRILCFACNPIFSQGALVLLTAVSSRKNKLEVLDLTGVRVDMQFIKMLNKVTASGRNFVAIHGRRLSCDTCAARDQFDSTSMGEMIALANHHDVSLRNFLQKIHADYLQDRRARSEKPEDEEIKKTVITEQIKMDDERYPRIKVTKFVQILTNSYLEVSEDLAQAFAEEFADDRNTINIGEIIIKIPLEFDDFEAEN